MKVTRRASQARRGMRTVARTLTPILMLAAVGGCTGALGGPGEDPPPGADAATSDQGPRPEAGPGDGAPASPEAHVPLPDQGPQPDLPPPCTKDCVPMVWVPKGTFLMGATNVPGESRPQHQVTLTHGFWLDKYEVSQKRYQGCIDDGVCSKPSGSFDPALDRAVYGVSWQMARAYCQWAGKRLPTEAEWERAGCGDGTRCYPWGGQKQGGSDCTDKPDCNKAAHCLASGCAGGPCYDKPVDVHAFEAAGNVSAFGAVNMAGNVWEWVEDPWTPSFDWCTSNCVDPVASASTSDHVIKGGAWISEEVFLRCAARYNCPGGFPEFEVGIRCAASP